MDANEELGQQMMRDLVRLHSLIDAYARTRDHRIRPPSSGGKIRLTRSSSILDARQGPIGHRSRQKR
jgi:hypothetical protein